MTEYVEIGFTQKTHGVNGALKFSVEDAYWDIFEAKGRIFIDIKGIKVPYFVREIQGAHQNILLLEDVSNKDAALGLQSKTIYLLKSDLPRGFTPQVEDPLTYGHLEGFIIVDQNAGEIGAITEVLDMPQQEMAFLRYREREILIPLNETFIREIDEANRKVLMDLPEGLLDV